MFGSNVTYDLVDSQYTKSDYTSDITLYAPEVIEIRYPKNLRRINYIRYVYSIVSDLNGMLMKRMRMVSWL